MCLCTPIYIQQQKVFIHLKYHIPLHCLPVSQSFSQPACLPTNPIRPTCISCRPPHHVRHTDSDGPTKSHAASPVGTVTLVICGVFVLRAVHNSLLSTTFSIRFLIFARVFSDIVLVFASSVAICQ